ncbi:hypothetical protein NL676_010362 [Syzygium grande]|nr:hypothetical protein NL676_010362 [Syzygium grande]
MSGTLFRWCFRTAISRAVNSVVVIITGQRLREEEKKDDNDGLLGGSSDRGTSGGIREWGGGVPSRTPSGNVHKWKAAISWLMIDIIFVATSCGTNKEVIDRSHMVVTQVLHSHHVGFLALVHFGQKENYCIASKIYSSFAKWRRADLWEKRRDYFRST